MAWAIDGVVVVPIDFSQDTLWAIDVAKSVTGGTARIRPVHVAPVLSAAEPGVVWELVSDEARAKHIQEEFVKEYGSVLPGATVTVLFGDPGAEIADYAEREHAALVVLPSHGRTGLSRLLIGSVAERVVRLAHCPVLVLRREARK